MTMSPFLAALRAEVGHRLLLLPSVTVLVDDPDDRGRTLLVRHTGNGRWGMIGGMVEPEEHPTVAAVRETEEETGLQVEIVDLVTVTGGPGYTVTYPNGDRTSYVSSVYRARIIGGEGRPDGVEVDGLEWFDRDQLRRLALGPFATTLLTELEYL
ncbi:MAG: NUDIX domain-containing protein [Actinomycetota bacterium]